MLRVFIESILILLSFFFLLHLNLRILRFFTEERVAVCEALVVVGHLCLEVFKLVAALLSIFLSQPMQGVLACFGHLLVQISFLGEAFRQFDSTFELLNCQVGGFFPLFFQLVSIFGVLKVFFTAFNVHDPRCVGRSLVLWKSVRIDHIIFQKNYYYSRTLR